MLHTVSILERRIRSVFHKVNLFTWSEKICCKNFANCSFYIRGELLRLAVLYLNFCFCFVLFRWRPRKDSLRLFKRSLLDRKVRRKLAQTWKSVYVQENVAKMKPRSAWRHIFFAEKSEKFPRDRHLWRHFAMLDVAEPINFFLTLSVGENSPVRNDTFGFPRLTSIW